MKEAILKQIRQFIRPFTKIKNIGRYPLVGWLYGLLIAIMNPITINGSKMYISRRDGLGLLVTPEHEKYETRLISWWLEEGAGDTVIDIGAHIGYFTMLMAKKVGSNGTVIAFEPDKDNFKLLIKSKLKNKYFQIIAKNVAVSDKESVAKLYLRGDGVSRRLWDGEGFDSVLTTTTSLDYLFRNIIGCVSLIKIDVEGCEAKIIRGGKETLKKTDRVIMEWRPADIREMGDDPLEALKTLEELGFTIREIDDQNEETIEVDDLNGLCKDTIKTNLYCIKQ